MTNTALWNATTRDEAFVEMRCKGLSPAQIRVLLAKRFAAREKSIEAVLGPRQPEDYMPIGRKCSAYRGATVRYERRLAELERRLTQPHL